MKKLQILLVLPFVFMACSESNDPQPELSQNSNARQAPNIVISSATGIKECVNGVKEYGALFTVDQTTWDYYYDGGGGTSYNYLNVRICSDSDCNNTVTNGFGKDLKSCYSSRVNRTTIVNLNDGACNQLKLPDLSANTTYYLRLERGSTLSNIVSFTTPAAGSLPCSLD
jgi:hypothetical protein